MQPLVFCDPPRSPVRADYHPMCLHVLGGVFCSSLGAPSCCRLLADQALVPLVSLLRNSSRGSLQRKLVGGHGGMHSAPGPIHPLHVPNQGSQGVLESLPVGWSQRSAGNSWTHLHGLEGREEEKPTGGHAKCQQTFTHYRSSACTIRIT